MRPQAARRRRDPEWVTRATARRRADRARRSRLRGYPVPGLTNPIDPAPHSAIPAALASMPPRRRRRREPRRTRPPRRRRASAASLELFEEGVSPGRRASPGRPDRRGRAGTARTARLDLLVLRVDEVRRAAAPGCAAPPMAIRSPNEPRGRSLAPTTAIERGSSRRCRGRWRSVTAHLDHGRRRTGWSSAQPRLSSRGRLVPD